jgi:hypothetical protein
MMWMIKRQLANDIWMMWMKISFTMTVRRCLTTLCARARERCWQQLRRECSSLLELSLCSALLLYTDFSIVGVSLWRAYVGFLSLFSLEVRALRVAKGVFSFCFGKEYCVLGGRRE